MPVMIIIGLILFGLGGIAQTVGIGMIVLAILSLIA